jgi:hypothetical protein
MIIYVKTVWLGVQVVMGVLQTSAIRAKHLVQM